MVIRFAGLYKLFEPESVSDLIRRETNGAGRYEYRLLLEFVRVYYTAENPEQALNTFAEEMKGAKLSKSIYCWRAEGYAESSASRTVIISDRILRENIQSLKYAEYPRRIYETINYYRGTSPDELMYIVNWTEETGLSQSRMLSGIKSALSLNDHASLSDMMDFVMSLSPESEDFDHERNYRTAMEILMEFNQDEENRSLKDEIKYTGEWYAMGFTRNDILLACSRTINSPTFQYLNAILVNAKKVMDRTGLKSYKEVDDVCHEYRKLLHASGKEQMSIDNIAMFFALRKKYNPDLIAIAADTACREHEGAIAGKKLLIYTQRVLDKWEERGVRSIEDAQALCEEQTHIMDLFQRCIQEAGFSLTDYEKASFKRSLFSWIKHGYTDSEILRAASAASEADNPMRYMSTVLKNGDDSLPY